MLVRQVKRTSLSSAALNRTCFRFSPSSAILRHLLCTEATDRPMREAMSCSVRPCRFNSRNYTS